MKEKNEAEDKGKERREKIGLAERHDPNSLSSFSQCTKLYPRIGDLNSCPPDLEFGALI